MKLVQASIPTLETEHYFFRRQGESGNALWTAEHKTEEVFPHVSRAFAEVLEDLYTSLADANSTRS